ncbi:ABC transporter ATP-binding protein [Nguyenibacter sp. L1]|uniref:ABC transporter ATP-binding protein n=1 Tax=Nguyenibacter sp. L1 TaxID=3049350 RepID=UPI002B48BC70|nr:ABC transporter ATP-binding protein [Nguyenibacter sp. L1]WRH88381.1 ABC transporter ATP-binding protein [Nguyenibacter sp. L1]
MTAAPVLALEELRVAFGGVAVLDGVSFTIGRGETLALVGESGSGKSVAALAVMGMLRGGRVSGGRILFGGADGAVDLAAMSERALRAYRGRRIAMIFQEPMSALNPAMRIGAQLGECLALHRPELRGGTRREAAAGLLARTGIADPDRCLGAYPHRLSGGMRQRVMIAMALAGTPALLIADEPTTALDAGTRGRILALIRDLAAESGTSTLFITHDFGSAAAIADRVAVLYAGRILEDGPIGSVLRAPRHPYTRGLLAAMPDPDGMVLEGQGRRRLRTMAGAVPPPGARPEHCVFAPRCPQRADVCTAGRVDARSVDARRVACARAQDWLVAP